MTLQEFEERLAEAKKQTNENALVLIKESYSTITVASIEVDEEGDIIIEPA